MKMEEEDRRPASAWGGATRLQEVVVDSSGIVFVMTLNAVDRFGLEIPGVQ
jgi:hypothetical protein